MKNIIKRLLISLLIISVLACTPVFAINIDIEAPLSDYDYSVEVLVALGVLNKADILDSEDWITRAQAAHFVASLTGVSDLGIQITNMFTDVNEKTSYADDIHVLSQLGVLHGYGDGSFKPYNDVSTSELIKIILSSIGYTVPSEENGGYMAGYMRYAASTGLLDGVESEMEEPVIFADVIKMFCNALDINVMSRDTYSEDDLFLTVTEGKTVLTELLHANRAEGVVTASSFCNITSSLVCDIGSVAIDGMIFLEGNSNAGQLIGHKVEYYFREVDDNDYEILFAYPIDIEDTITITDSEFEDYTGSSFVYFKDGKTRSARVNSITNILYNYSPANISLDFSLSNGTITAIDNDSDGVCDVVFIEQFRNIHTQYVDCTGGVIYDKYNSAEPVNIELTDVGHNVLIYDRKGNPIDFENLKSDSLLSCLISEDGKTVIIYEVVEEVLGVIEGIEDSGSSKYITINGNSYSIAPELENSGVEWKLGQKVICYLDKTGKLAIFDGSKATKYRWAIFEDISAEGGLSQSLSVRIFDEYAEEGKLSVYDIADKITINGSKNEESTLVKLSWEELVSKMGGNRGLIMFTLNADKEINSIITEESDEIYRYSNYSSYLVSASTRILGSSVGYSPNTLLFTVPGAGAGDENFSVGKASTILSGNRSYTLKVYKLNPESLDADVLVLENADKANLFSRYSPSMIVDSITEAVNEDGDIVKRIYGYRGTSYVSYDAENEDTFSTVKAFSNPDLKDDFSLEKGDLIKFETNSKNKIRAAQLICRATEGKIFASANPSAVYSNASRVILGPVYRIEGDGFQVTAKADASAVTDSDLELFRIISSTPVYLYDSVKDEVRIGSSSDMIDYCTNPASCTKIAVYSDAGKINALLIIK